MKLQSAEEERGARVEMTPMMDVVFLLLVFFIYAFLSMSVQRGVTVHLPKAGGDPIQGQKIQVVLTAEDTLLLDGRSPMEMAAVVDALALRSKTLQLPVLIRADRQAHAGPALELMAKLRAQGVDRIVYQVEKER
ncbi:MAG: biopolymer transporter ExbD [Kiritimatiellia bacterium]